MPRFRTLKQRKHLGPAVARRDDARAHPLRLCEPEMIFAAPRISPVVRISVDLAGAQAEAADSQSAAAPT